MDTNLSDHVAQVVREAIRDELRERTTKQRRTALLYTGSGAAGLYAGAALTAFLVLALAAFLPGWAATLIVGVVLAVVAVWLKSAARQESSPSAAVYPPEVPPLPPHAPETDTRN
ncbi:phage holin family protein [Streptomyces sp. NPDC006208]|uniref:phage holin family protein n=1 Tax=Streptomyces sp. NPDC006208 TaxID=3156734 RepID=UPI0033B03F24